MKGGAGSDGDGCAAGAASDSPAAWLGGLADSGIHSHPAPAARADLQRILHGLVTGPDRIAPGVTAYVAGPHDTWLGSAGVANVQTGEPMRPDARTRLDSVSKWWATTVVLQLAQEGKLRLGDTVQRWLPGLLPYGNRITIEQLMTDSSGLIDDNDLCKPVALSQRPRPRQGRKAAGTAGRGGRVSGPTRRPRPRRCG